MTTNPTANATITAPTNGAKPAASAAPATAGPTPPLARPAAPPTQKPTAPSSPRSRMTLDAITTADDKLFKLFIYGVEGIGKSTLARGAEAPVWLPVENPKVKGIRVLPQPTTLEEVHEAIAMLAAPGPHPYKTLVIDTVDALEWLIWQKVTGNGTTTMVKAGGGYGAGYNTAYEEWRKLLASLDRLITAKSMNVILIGHCTVTSAPNPDGDNYDRYSSKLFQTKQTNPGGLIRGWCDAVLFANYEVTTYKGEKDKTAKAVAGGARFLHTQWRPAFDAKNRYNMPPTLPLAWAEVEPYLLNAPDASASALVAVRESIAAALEKLADVPPEKFNRVGFEKAMTVVGDDAAALGRLLERLTAKIAIEIPEAGAPASAGAAEAPAATPTPAAT